MSTLITIPTGSPASQFSGFGHWSKDHSHADNTNPATYAERPSLNVDYFSGKSDIGTRKPGSIPALNSALDLLRSGELKKKISMTPDPSYLTKKSNHFANRVLFSTNQQIKHQ